MNKHIVFKKASEDCQFEHVYSSLDVFGPFRTTENQSTQRIFWLSGHGRMSVSWSPRRNLNSILTCSLGVGSGLSDLLVPLTVRLALGADNSMLMETNMNVRMFISRQAKSWHPGCENRPRHHRSGFRSTLFTFGSGFKCTTSQHAWRLLINRLSRYFSLSAGEHALLWTFRFPLTFHFYTEYSVMEANVLSVSNPRLCPQCPSNEAALILRALPIV